MASKRGTLSINSDNILPIIKKWMYSDHDIFFRELISNGCDAITKLKKLEVMGEYSFPENHKNKIQVIVNPEEKTLKFIDTGLGMTADEVEEYITQIAFSGATQFLEKYKDKTNEDQIIGHFGLGFYSAFMVADEVQIDTLSYKEDATPVHWSSDGGTEYEIGDGNRTEVGTEITLFLNEESVEFANEYRAREIIEKYCSFMPVEIFLSKANAPQEYETIEESELKEDDVVVEHIHEDAKTEEKENENGEKEVVETSPAKEMVKIHKRPVSLSDTNPLWMKHPNECTEEEYKDFYRKVFMDYKEPLFWIHLNMDYPFNLKGILYFPKINMEYESIEGTIKLYNNQVFIADNIKEVIPEFLMLLKGVIDCPDLPLNVSRSALQNDGFVKKISDYISKKVADKLSGMCKTDRENYEKYWDDISPFIKFGCIKDSKFSERMMDYILYKNIDGKYLTLEDCIKENAKETPEDQEVVTEEDKEEVLEEAKEYADQTMKLFHKFQKNNVDTSAVERERQELRKRMNKAEKNMSDRQETKKPKKQLTAKDIRPGDSVKVLSMNLKGTVGSRPDSKGFLFVQMGIIRSKVHLSDLELVDEPVITTPSLQKTGAGKIRMSKSASVSTEINLLGRTVDEAIAELDKYLDDAYIAHLKSVRIVHGKGTGALRKGIHDYLRRQKHVSSFRLGEFGEGDAGVTIVDFK